MQTSESKLLHFLPIAAALLLFVRLAAGAEPEPVPSETPPRVDVARMVAASDPATLAKYRFVVHGEGTVTAKDEDAGGDVSGVAFVDLRIERNDAIDGAPLKTGVHARAFISTADLKAGEAPTMSDVLRIVEAYAEYLPDGRDGIHVVRASVGRTWVAFGYGADERAAFASFPLASKLSTAGIGFAPNATLAYENKRTGVVVEGSLFAKQDADEFLDLENQGYSLRVRKGIAISTHLKAEAMASYADLYSPTTEERGRRFAFGAKATAELDRAVKLDLLAEGFHQNAETAAVRSEVSGWLAVAQITKGRLTAGVRHSRTWNAAGKQTEWTASGRYTVTRPNARVKADVTLELGRVNKQNQISVGVALARGKPGKKRR